MATSTIKKSIPRYLQFKSTDANDTVYTFTDPWLNKGSIGVVLCWGSCDPNMGFLLMIYEFNNSVTLQTIYNNSDRTFSASISGETITVTASAIIWGGMRFLSYNGNV